MTSDREIWLTPAQAAWRAGVTVPTIRLWITTRGLRYRRRRSGGKREYLASSLDAILAAGETEGPCS